MRGRDVKEGDSRREKIKTVRKRKREIDEKDMCMCLNVCVSEREAGGKQKGGRTAHPKT
jgi:hypothetical protein